MRVRHPELVLAAATLVSAPMLPGLIDGGISPLSALVRFLIALVACWMAGSILSRLITAYTNQVRRAAIAKQIEEENTRRRIMAEEALRRRADRATGAAGATGATGQNGVPGSNGISGNKANVDRSNVNGSNGISGNDANRTANPGANPGVNPGGGELRMP
ncbi:MAG: hypothetical protein M1420_00935 [Actinobacteria bacterium]|jgi:hypothetical protein|nr:hypothetical protein [Actinomycetota bacterium]